MPTLYVTTPGAKIEKEYSRLSVMKEDEELFSAPLAQVSEVVTIGRVGITIPAMLALLGQGANLSLITRQGRLLGRLIAAEARNLPLRHTQYARSHDPAFCLAVSKIIVMGKLKNSRTFLRRAGRAHPPDGQSGRAGASGEAYAFALRGAIRRVGSAPTLAALRGVEGAAARLYFGGFKQALRAGYAYEKRARRPPGDPVNALLSLSYALLGQTLFTACEVAGLDAYDGFFHADKYSRPALALDLMEEFRSIAADSVTLRVINQRIIHPHDFEPDDDPDGRGGIRLNSAALRKFTAQFARRLNTPVFYPPAGRLLALRKVMEAQAWRMRRAIEHNDPAEYAPFLPK